MKKSIFNSKKILKIGVLAVFLFSWLSSANATVLCECEEGHITVENIYTGYCNIDLNHDHGAQGHSDITCDCEDTPITVGNISFSQKLDFDFNYSQAKVKIDTSFKTFASNQNHIAYALSKDRLTYNIKNPLRTIILII
jgi:hypothetical protein